MNNINNPYERQPASFRQTRITRNPRLRKKLDQMALNLSPLVQVTTGHVHPWFPRTVLQFWLLTNDQLDALAHFYHQRTPCSSTYEYPCPIFWSLNLPLEEKRRQIGKFIGLRGCETPELQSWDEQPQRPFADDAVHREATTNSSAEKGLELHRALIKQAQTAERARMLRIEADRPSCWGYMLTEEQIAERARLMGILLAEEEMWRRKTYPVQLDRF